MGSLEKKLDLMHMTCQMVSEYFTEIDADQRTVVDFHLPEALKKQVSLAVGPTGVSDTQIKNLMQMVLDYSVATQHPLFFNQLYAGADIYGIIGERMTAVLNTSMYTYEVGPLFTLMEEELYDRLQTMLGWDTATGMMLPGGSTCNLYALQIARHHLDPTIRKNGMNGKKFAVFTSDQSHYSITKSVMVMGMGSERVIIIKTDKHGCMIVSDLEDKILEAQKNGLIPMMINATAGTTVLGSYDNIEGIAHVAKQYEIWLHVDGIRGGAVLFSETLRGRLQGIEDIDSFCVNPHKMLGAPLQCSIFLTKHSESVETCNVLKAPYLFQDERGYDATCDTGDLYIQCGRRVDVLKLRLMRKAYGEKGFAQRVDRAFTMANYLKQQVDAAERLMVVDDSQCTNLCFWYLPREYDTSKTTRSMVQKDYDRIHVLNARIKERLLKEGKTMIGIANIPSKQLPYFFRMIVISPDVHESHLDFVVEEIQRIGEIIESTL